MSDKSRPRNVHIWGSTPYLALFLFLLAVYLLTYTPRVNSSDGIAMFATAESLARRGALDIEQIRWMGLQQGTFGLDDWLYSRKGIGLPLGLLPLTWLGLVVPWLGTVSVSLLFNAIVTALTAVVLLAYIELLGFSRRTGLIVALTFGLATLAWPYAKSLFSDPFSGLLLLAAAYVLLKYYRVVTTWEDKVKEEVDSYPLVLLLRYPIRFRWYHLGYLHYPFLAGLFVGWNVATRYAEALFVPVFGLLLLTYLGVFKSRRILFWVRYPGPNPWPPLVAFAAPIALVGLTLFVFNISRYGDPFNTGYLPEETFSAIWGQGILGQLVSPGRGLLLYSPVLILSFFGVTTAFRHYRVETLLALSIILIHLLLYGKWFMWHGGFAWGPRFMIPTLPFWAIFLAPVVVRAFPEKVDSNSNPHYARNSGRAILRLIFIGLAVLTLIPQTLTLLLDFSPFQGYLLDTGLPLFAPETFFELQYAPLIKGWNFFTLPALDVIWAWRGQINWWLLIILVVNVGSTGTYLFFSVTLPKNDSTEGRINEKTNHRLRLHPASLIILSPWLPLFSTLMALLTLLLLTHNLPDSALQQTVDALNAGVRPTDAVILNDPAVTLDFAERYKGRAFVLGLNQGGFPLPGDVQRRLDETTGQHRQVWWLPNRLPPEASAIEQILLTTGFRARNESFAGRRLGLFAFPQHLTAREVEADFGGQIRLNQVVLPGQITSGTALPIELRWQAIAPLNTDYHVFIHLIAADGQMTTQADGQPVLWTRPTSSWEINENILDRHALWLPPDTSAGNYQLRIGLYHPESGERLRLSDEEDSVKLDISIE